MHLPILIESVNGHFVARLASVPEVKAEASTPAGAMEALRTIVDRRIDQGDLAFMTVEPKGIHADAGIFKDDPWLDEIREEAYRYRDELRKKEIGE